jgi:hypothetical protein
MLNLIWRSFVMWGRNVSSFVGKLEVDGSCADTTSARAASAEWKP